jgi:hypothetical protein
LPFTAGDRLLARLAARAEMNAGLNPTGSRGSELAKVVGRTLPSIELADDE